MTQGVKVFVLMVLIGAMFWCIELLHEPDPSPLVRMLFILVVAGMVTLPYVRTKDKP